MNINALFTYGTLKPGEEANYLLQKTKGSWLNAYVKGNWITNSKIGYPVIKLDPDGEKIKGKLFNSNNLESIIQSIDIYEGSEYKRSITEAYVEDGSMQKAYVYELA